MIKLDKTSKEPTEGKEEEKMPEDQGIGKDEPVYHDIGEDEEEEEKGSST